MSTSSSESTQLDAALLEEIREYLRLRENESLPELVAVCDACGLGTAQAHAHEPVRRDRVADAVREAFVARVRAFGAREVRQRSAQELVFIVLAWAVGVMITAPAIVPVLLALRGVKP